MTLAMGTFDDSQYGGLARRDIVLDLLARTPWLPRAAIRAFVDYWIAGGTADEAWASVQQDERYEEWFPGLRRDDGTIRMPEAQYYATMRGYENVIHSIGLPSRIFKDDFVELVRGDVTVTELSRRVNEVTARVLNTLPSIQREFAELSGIDTWTQTDIIAAMLKPTLGVEMLDKRITLAEISGEAAEAGFDLIGGMARRLYDVGVDRSQARQLFGEAQDVLPILRTLARRHADPDDDFSLEDFTAASVFNDPVERRRMFRLMQQERAMFTETGVFGVRTNQLGALSGLGER